MKIGIIGTGSMADALGVQWAAKGHGIVVGGRSREKAAALAGKIGHGARAGTIREAAEFGEVVLLAVSHDAVAPALEASGAGQGALGDKVLIDCNNPIDVSTFLPKQEFSPSMAEYIAERAKGAQVVKAFNMSQARVWQMTPPLVNGSPLGVPYCGDAEKAKAKVAQLISDLGCTPHDVGPLRLSRLLEPAADLVISQIFARQDSFVVLNLTRAG